MNCFSGNAVPLGDESYKCNLFDIMPFFSSSLMLIVISIYLSDWFMYACNSGTHWVGFRLNGLLVDKIAIEQCSRWGFEQMYGTSWTFFFPSSRSLSVGYSFLANTHSLLAMFSISFCGNSFYRMSLPFIICITKDHSIRNNVVQWIWIDTHSTFDRTIRCCLQWRL